MCVALGIGGTNFPMASPVGSFSISYHTALPFCMNYILIVCLYLDFVFFWSVFSIIFKISGIFSLLNIYVLPCACDTYGVTGEFVLSVTKHY